MNSVETTRNIVRIVGRICDERISDSEWRHIDDDGDICMDGVIIRKVWAVDLSQVAPQNQNLTGN